VAHAGGRGVRARCGRGGADQRRGACGASHLTQAWLGGHVAFRAGCPRCWTVSGPDRDVAGARGVATPRPWSRTDSGTTSPRGVDPDPRKTDVTRRPRVPTREQFPWNSPPPGAQPERHFDNCTLGSPDFSGGPSTRSNPVEGPSPAWLGGHTKPLEWKRFLDISGDACRVVTNPEKRQRVATSRFALAGRNPHD